MLTRIENYLPVRLLRRPMMYALGLSVLAVCPPVSGQGLALDTPTEVERARAKAEKAWQAWEAARPALCWNRKRHTPQPIRSHRRNRRLRDTDATEHPHLREQTE